MPSYNSIIPYTGDGVQTRWNANFSGGFIDPEHVFVVIDGTDSPAVFENAATIVIDPPVPAGVRFVIERRTPNEVPLVDYGGGAFFTEENLDTTAKQSVFVAAEAADRFGYEIDRTIRVPDGEAGVTLPSQTQRLGGRILGFDPVTGAPRVQSAGDFKGDPGGNVESTGLFDEIAAIAIRSGTDRASTTGKSVVGVGAATLISDDLADSDLLAAHPLAVTLDAAGRIFRTLPQKATISPEMLGCPTYAPGVNAQPYVQAAIRYAEAVRCGIHFEQNTYEIWTPLRVPDPGASATSPVPRGEPTNYTGLPLVVRRKVELRAAPGGTTFIRRTNSGGDPAVFANTQTTSDNYGYGYWRGGMFALIPQAVEPDDPDDLAAVVLHGDWTIYGGLERSATPGLYTSGGKYRLRPDGTGWDIYDKAFWAFSANGTDYIGKLAEVYGTLKVDGFAGETFFGGVRHRGMLVRGSVEVCNSDGGHFDFGMHNSVEGSVFDADVLWAHHVYLGMERFGGRDIRIKRLRINDCNVAGNCFGGDYTDDDLDDGDPNFVIDVLDLASNGIGGGAANFQLVKNVRVGEVICRDCGVTAGSSSYTIFKQGNISIGRVRAIADKASAWSVMVFSSHDTTPGSFALNNVIVGEVICERTPEAVANNRVVGRAVSWNSGSFGSNCFVGSVSGECSYASMAVAAGDVPDCHVGIGRSQHKFYTGGDFWNGETTPQLAFGRAFYELLATTTPGNFTVTMPDPAKYPVGARVRVRNREGSNAKTFTVATTNTRLPKRAFLPNQTAIEFEQIGGVWVPQSGSRHVLTGTSGSVNLQKSAAAIPAGDVSDETTFTVNGAKAGMSVRVTPTSVISGDAQLIGRVTADNTVGIRARNMNLGGTLDIGAATYRVELEWAS